MCFFFFLNFTNAILLHPLNNPSRQVFHMTQDQVHKGAQVKGGAGPRVQKLPIESFSHQGWWLLL